MIEIVRPRDGDIKGIVSIHHQAFPDFFLTTLGDDFLYLYYSCMCKSKDAVTLCAKQDDIIVGFATSSFFSQGFNKSLIKNNFFRFGLMAIKLLFTRPKAVVRLLNNLDKDSSDKSIVDNGDYAELYSIAVSPRAQGSGIGKELLTMTEKEVAKHNSRISLTTDYYNNEKTIGFYHSLGYEDYYDFITYPQRRMWRLIKKL